MTADSNSEHAGESVSESRSSQIVEMVGPGETTVKPLTGKLLDVAKAERAKIEAWLKERQQGQQPAN